MTKNEHLHKAQENERFALALMGAGIDGDWAITALFYSALHYVQAYFARQRLGFHLHKTRDSAIIRDPAISPIYDDYRELQDQSRSARYDKPSGSFTQADFDDLRKCLDEVKAVVGPLI